MQLLTPSESTEMFSKDPVSRALLLPSLRPLQTTPHYHLLLPALFLSATSSFSCLSTPTQEPVCADGADSGAAHADSADAMIRRLLRTTDPSAVSSALRQCGVSPTPSLVASLLDSPSSPLPSLPAASLLSLSLWARPHLPARLLASLVDLLARSRSFHSAWTLLLSSPSPLPAFAPLLRRYARAGSPSAAVRTFRFLLRRPESLAPDDDSRLSPDPFDLLVDALCKEGHPRAAADLVRRRRSEEETWTPSARIYNVLLHGWFRARRLKKAEWLWDELRRDGVRPTVVTYGTLIEGLCRMRRPDQATALLGEMKAAGIEPNLIACNPILDSLAEAGRFEDALAVLEKFPLYGVSPDISTYNSLVKGFCKNGDLAGASKMIKSMIGRGILPTATTYNYFFRFFAEFRRIEEGMSLYTKMVHSGYAPDRLTFHLLIKMFCENDKLDLAVQMIKEMNRSGFESDLATSTMLVHLLCRMRRFEDACEEFEEMFKRGIVPQYITYRMLMKELKRLGMPELEKKLSDLMRSVPHSTKLPGSYRDTEGDETVKLRKSIIKKAQAMSDALKECKDPADFSRQKSSTESVLESANTLIADIRRSVYAVQSD